MQSLKPREAGDENGPQPIPASGWPRDRFLHANQFRAQAHRYRIALLQRWWILLVCLLVIGGPAIYLALERPARYRSEATMWLAGRLSLPGGRLYSEELSTYMGTQAELLRSSSIQSRAFEKIRAQFPELTTLPNPRLISGSPFRLSVLSSPRNSVLQLEAMGLSPEATRAFLDAVMSEYVLFKQDSRKQTSYGALAHLNDQIKEVESQIQHEQQELTIFQMSNNIPYLTEHASSAGSHLARLTESLSGLRTEHRVLESYESARSADSSESAGALPSIAGLPEDNTVRPLTRNATVPQAAYYQTLQQLELSKSKRNEFLPVLRPTHSKMIKLNQEIAGFEQLLATLRREGEQQILVQLTQRKKSLEFQIQNLENQYLDWETNASEASRKLADFECMKQELQRSQGLYDRLLSLLQTVDLNKSLDQEPLTPLAPASPGRATLAKIELVAAGIVLSIILGVGLIVMLELFDDRFNSATELGLHLREVIAGEVPERSSRVHYGKAHRLRPAEDEWAFAESFRNLRSFLLLFTGNGVGPKTILVTSAVPREGKTTVALHLAQTLANAGSTVLLVDADSRRNPARQVSKAGDAPGLREILSRQFPPSQAVAATHHPNLFLLPGGAGDSDVDHGIARGALDEKLRELRGHYDYLIIDSPPVLASDDAVSLGQMSDGVLLVVRAAYTSARFAREALDQLHQRKVKVLGLIYNRATPSTDFYYRYRQKHFSTERVSEVQALTEAGSSETQGPARHRS